MTWICYDWYIGVYDENNANYSAGGFEVTELMTNLFPAVYEAYNKSDCMDPGEINFGEIQLGANTFGGVTNYVGQTYSPTSCTAAYNYCSHPGTGLSCIWGTDTSGTTTILF